MRSVFQTILLLILTTTSLSGQIPKEYEDQLQDQRRENRKLEREYDFVLDPIEQIGITPQDYSVQAGGNWGYNYLEVEANAGQIDSRAQKKIAVFIFDTAGEWTHPGLSKFAWNAKGKVFTGEASPADGNGHSTHCAGIIGGLSDTYNIGIGAQMVENNLLKGIPYKVLSNDGGGNFSSINTAISTANAEARALIASGWGVVYSFSLGGGTANQPATDELIRQAEDIGVFVVCAAGNTGKEGVNAPANGGSAHAVGSLDRTGTHSYFSTFGAKLYSGAPGAGIMSTYPPDQYRELSGTSMATPGQAAVAAILMSVFPTATNRQISHYIKAQSTDLETPGWDKYTGWGASLITRLLSGDPTTYPKTGNGNPGSGPADPEPPTKKKRDLNIVLSGNYTINWKPLTDTGPFRAAFLNFTVESKTGAYAEWEADRVEKVTAEFFGKYNFLLTADADFADAGYWAAYFYEKLLNKEGNTFKVLEYTVHDSEGRTAWKDRQSAQKLAYSMQLMSRPEIMAFPMEK